MSDSPAERVPFFARPVGKIVIVWLIFSIVGILIGIYAPSRLMPKMFSVEGNNAVETTVLFTILAAPVAAVVYGIAFYSLFGWRHRGDLNVAPPDGPPIRGNTKITTIWLVTSGVLVLALLSWGLVLLSAEQTTHPHTLVVDVTGQQWLWTFKYPGTNVESHTLELPVNRTVEFEVTSLDVVHGFWLDAFGVQVDANPGEITSIQTTINKEGNFTLRCSNLCGLYHSFMYAPVSVVSGSDFAKWLVHQGASTTAAQTAALTS